MPAKQLESALSTWLVVGLGLGVVILALLPKEFEFGISDHDYLPLHTFLEFIGILVSFMIFTVGWATFNNINSRLILLLSVTSFSVGLLDFAHTLSFPEMPSFFTPNDPDKAIYFWLAARLTGAMALFAAAFWFYGPATSGRYARFVGLGLALLWTAFCFWIILDHPGLLPPMFVKGAGLTVAKVTVEVLIIILFSAAAWKMWRRSPLQNLLSSRWFAFSCLTMAMAEALFSFYWHLTDIIHFAGHVYKAIGYAFLYRAVFVECVSRPYEEIRRYADEVRRANETKTQFLANVSHELRTPLGVVVGFSELLFASKKLDPDLRKWVGTIRRNSEQLRFLIDDLLDLTKVEADHLLIERSSVDLDALLEEAIGGLQLSAERKGIRLRIFKSLGVPSEVYVDAMRLRQILLNVIGNAIKFTEKGQVEVMVDQTSPVEGGESLLRFTVKDTGIGLTDEEAQRLFQPFSQADASTSRRYGGTGLGLALSHRLARLLGGDLWLAESRPNQGSTFCLTVAGAVPLLSMGEHLTQVCEPSDPIKLSGGPPAL